MKKWPCTLTFLFVNVGTSMFILPFMYVDELCPYDGMFVLPFIHDQHWGILVTDVNVDGLKEFIVLPDLQTTFEEVQHRIRSVDPMSFARCGIFLSVWPKVGVETSIFRSKCGGCFLHMWQFMDIYT